MTIAWSAWVIILISIVFAFWWLWRFAERIEREEMEEEQWRAYIAELWQYDPNQALYWQTEFERRFIGGR